MATRSAHTTRTGFTGPDNWDCALEYGGGARLLLVLDAAEAKRSWLELPASTPEEELNKTRGDYPTELKSADGEMIWFSRFPNTDRRVSTPYECEYGWWLTGDPSPALKLILVIGEDGAALRDYVRCCIALLGGGMWHLKT